MKLGRKNRRKCPVQKLPFFGSHCPRKRKRHHVIICLLLEKTQMLGSEGVMDNRKDRSFWEGHGEELLRIIQESVPGKQVTMAHIVSSPDPSEAWT